jgi:hypothetical protein
MSANKFLSLPPIEAGANIGPGTALDLSQAVPNTGLDAGITVICCGRFEGTIVVEGSLDGKGFSMVGSFTVGALRPGDPDPEFEPLCIKDITMFLRTRVAPGTKVWKETIVTIGGVPNTTGQNRSPDLSLSQGHAIKLSPPDKHGKVAVHVHLGSSKSMLPVGAENRAGTIKEAAAIDHTHRGVPALESTDGGLVLESQEGHSDPWLISQRISAEWHLGFLRIFALDAVNGDDKNKGYVDAKSDYGAACRSAGKVAKKTPAALAAIIPRVGKGRQFEIVVANGGEGVEQIYQGDLSALVNGISGYDVAILRATGSNPTAFCMAFEGSENDVIYQGAIPAHGTRKEGYLPKENAVATCITFDGGGGNTMVGWRLRFDAKTATPSLRNVCRTISGYSDDKFLVPTAKLPCDPTPEDRFYVEQAGVCCDTLDFQSIDRLSISGIRAVGAWSSFGSRRNLCFGGGGLILASSKFDWSVSSIMKHPVFGDVTVGGGLRSNGSCIIDGSAASYLDAGQALSRSRVAMITFSGTFKGGGDSYSYLSDRGFGDDNKSTSLCRPSPAVVFSRLKLTVVQNTAANVVTACLLKNGEPTRLKIEIPAGCPPYTKLDVRQLVTFNEGDTFDLRLEGEEGGQRQVDVSACLEYLPG